MTANPITHKGKTIEGIDKIESLKPVYGNMVRIYYDTHLVEYDDPDGSLNSLLSDMLKKRRSK